MVIYMHNVPDSISFQVQFLLVEIIKYQNLLEFFFIIFDSTDFLVKILHVYHMRVYGDNFQLLFLRESDPQHIINYFT